MKACDVSIVIPVRNDAKALERLLRTLASFSDPMLEVLVVDGNSEDGSAECARRAGVRLISSPPGRGGQLSAGVRASRGEWIWMVHADTAISASAVAFVRSCPDASWGRFDVAFDIPDRAMQIIAAMMNWRSRTTGICTGDQAIFCHRSLLGEIGGMPEIPLMEDIELSRRLRRTSRPVCAPIRVMTSPRRWQRDGIPATVLSMWMMRLRYWAGADPAELARVYYR